MSLKKINRVNWWT